MTREADNYFLKLPEPAQSCMLALRNHLLNYGAQLTETWKYSMPVYTLRGKMFCYLWTDKKTGTPYIGIVNGNLIQYPGLMAGSRARMKTYDIDPLKDLPVTHINAILALAISVHP